MSNTVDKEDHLMKCCGIEIWGHKSENSSTEKFWQEFSVAECFNAVGMNEL